MKRLMAGSFLFLALLFNFSFSIVWADGDEWKRNTDWVEELVSQVEDLYRSFAGDGDATYYDDAFFAGKLTRNEEVYRPYFLTAASNTLPLETFARVTNLENSKSVVVWINDTGGFPDGDIDLSSSAFSKIASLIKGRIKVKIEILEIEEY